MFRHQLPAFSPLSLAAVLRAAGHAFSRDEVERARALVAHETMADAVALVDSGRAALQLGLDTALSVARSERVVALPAFQCFEVGAAAIGARCRIALYDVDPATLQPDMGGLEALLRDGVRIVVVAPLYGIPVDWDAIAAMAARYGGVIVEDAAQGHGASWRGRPLGSLATLSILSFGRGKGWTGGAGGALCARDDAGMTSAVASMELPEDAISSMGTMLVSSALQWAVGRPGAYGIPSGIPGLGLGETRYTPPRRPAAMIPASAALLSATAAGAKREAQVRRRIAQEWRDRLAEQAHVRIPRVHASAVAGYVRFPVMVREGASRLRQSQSALRAGIGSSYPMPLNRVPQLADALVNPEGWYPGAEALAREMVTLPAHSLVSAADRVRIETLLRKWG